MRLRRILQGLALFALLGLAALWIEHRTGITLPAPTGPFAIGRLIYRWADDAAPDKLAPAPGAHRELVVWIWYPAASTVAPGPMDDYLPAPWREAAERATVAPIRFLTRDLARVRGHSLRNADVSAKQPRYPVVILRAGASSEVVNYSTLAEDLASHGYIVVGLDAPYRTGVVVFPDGRVVRRVPANNPENCLELGGAEQAGCITRLLTAWTADMSFVLDRLARLNAGDPSGKFTGRLDLDRIGVLGHSFGGAQALQFCHDDPRCKAGVNLDGAPFGSVVREGLHQPFLFVLTDQIHSSGPETSQVLADIQSIYDSLPEGARWRILIRGSNHFLFSDDGALLKSHIVMRTLRLCGIVGIDGRRQLAVTSYCVRRFFDQYLKAEGGPHFGIPSPAYPEIEVLK